MLQFEEIEMRPRNKLRRFYKFKNPTTEIQRTWDVKPKMIPVTKVATGTVWKVLRQYLSGISGKHEIKEPQKTAILCTVHLPAEH
jgi:hypothetical protein